MKKDADIAFIRAFGENLRRLREEKNMSQEDLNHDAGLNKNAVGRIERAEHVLSLHAIKKLADALGVKPKDLLDF